jgi:hypothetical protein
MLESIYRLTAFFAQGAKADISARGTKRLKKSVCLFNYSEIKHIILDFKLLSSSECCTLSFEQFTGV